MEISSIDKTANKVNFDDNTSINVKKFNSEFTEFMQNRIAGETLLPADMEQFMRRTSGKNLSLLMKGKKMEGYMEGAMDRMLTKSQKIAIATVVTIVFVVIVVYMVLKNSGILPF